MSSTAITLSELAGERRVVTILFADLVDSTGTAVVLDPEDVMLILRLSRSICGEATERYGGHISKFMGDGIMALFGFPDATEQNTQRALNAALDMVEEHRTAKWMLPPGMKRPALRVGVHTGLVVIADIAPSGHGLIEHNAIVGSTPNLASRVHGAAPPDAVVMSEDSAREVAGQFETRSLGRQQLKGIEKPVEIFEVLARTVVGDQSQRVNRVPGVPMVGRQTEMDALQHCWKKVIEGGGCSMLLTGQAGMGKSRLVAEFLERNGAAAGAKTFFFQCSPYHRNTSFYPVARRLAELFEIGSGDAGVTGTPPEKLASSGVCGAEDVMLVQSVLGMPVSSLPQLAAMAPEVRKARTFAALTRCLDAFRAGAPAVLVFNDIHWLDGLTREWMESLCSQRIGGILLLVTMRPDATVSLPRGETLLLEPLDAARSRELATRAAGGKVLPREVLDHIEHHCGGVPLFVVEMTRSIIESGVIQESDAHFAIVPGCSVTEWSRVPLTLQELLLQRVESAGGAKRMLQFCAVIGEDFPAKLPEMLWAEAGLDDGARLISVLVATGLLQQMPDERLSFNHALLRSMAYDSTIKVQRAIWHRLVAEYLKAGGETAVEADPAVVAHHYMHAEMPEDAVVFSLRAALGCLGRSAYADAIAQAQQGLGLLPEGWKSIAEMRTLATQLATTLGVALMSSLGYSAPEVETAFRRAEAFGRLVGTPEALFPVQWGMWVVELMRGRLNNAEERAAAMMDLGTESGNTNFLIEGLWTMGVVVFYQGRLGQARELLEKAVAMYAPMHEQNAYLHGQDPGVAARTYLTFVLCFMGHTREAEQMSASALALARRLNHPHSLAWALGGATMLRLGLGDLAGTLRVGRAAMTECMEQEHAWWLCAIKLMVAWASAHAENPVLGYQQLEQAFDDYETRLRTDLVQPVFCAMLADAAALNGEREAAGKWVERGLRMAGQNGEFVNLPGVLLIAGQLRMTDTPPDPAEAERLFRRALALAHEQGARLRELQAASALAQLLAARGEGAEALALLQPLAEWFEQEQSLPLAAAARQFVGMLSAKGSPSPEVMTT